MSMKFSPTAAWRIRISPGPGDGTGASTSLQNLRASMTVEADGGLGRREGHERVPIRGRIGLRLSRSDRSDPMKINVEVDCTPAEARAFMGLPDVAPLNEHLVAEMKRRMDENITAMQPDELMKTWTSFGLQAQDQFRKLMETAVGGATKP
jgi:hypothetical protein